MIFFFLFLLLIGILDFFLVDFVCKLLIGWVNVNEFLFFFKVGVGVELFFEMNEKFIKLVDFIFF